MKRFRLHVYFWLAYLLYDTLLHFTWMGPALPYVPPSEQLWMGIKTAFSLLPIKLFLVYYIVLRGTQKVLRDDQKLIWGLLEFIAVFLLSAFFFRVASYYFTDPIIYGLHDARPLFNARSVFIAILEMGLVGGVAFALKLYRLQAIAREREKNLIKEKLETEIKFLRNQTNPHFLFNTLNNIYALSRKKSDKTPDVVMKLSELLSFMLYESGKESITIEEELKMMEDYIELQKIRYNDRLSVQLRKQIDNEAQPIAPLLLLPLVENAFKHGVSETRFDSFINIDIALHKSILSFCIENSIENGEIKKTNGSIGLDNAKRQLELMYKDYTLNMENLEKTFKVNITINLDSYGKI